MPAVTRDARVRENRPEPLGAAPPPEREAPDAPLTWRSAGLETMASMLVLSLRRLGSRGFEAWCQWPRSHPLNERALVVAHHPLIMVESVRQIAAALERRHLPRPFAPLEPGSVRLGLIHEAQPRERGVATAVLVRVAVSDLVLHGGRLVGYRLCADFLQAGLRFGSGTIRMLPRESGTAVGAAAGQGLVHPSAAAVGAAAEPDVMVARTSRGLAIAPRDPDHPVFRPGRSCRLSAVAVLEAGRQAALLSYGGTAAAVTGLSVDLRGPVPCAGASVEVAPDPLGRRFIVHTGGQVVAVGTVGLLRP
ncbi:hypothetical protein J2X68_005196 [Streptomyces sp. 3330]|uniref:hypothetical protein n=1 Tax=Streptomyces sp. 3330 TaxID=2817755 RepID=UPI0028604180|nr:hypothetical protein [Streptomyces sp. 3330]MDR6978470.1 hypothetical protein [Streptomyces sp. 3330]